MAAARPAPDTGRSQTPTEEEAVSQISERPRNARAPAALAPVLGLGGAGGVLSIYVDADPALGAGARPAWQAPVRVALRRLVRDTHRTGSREERIALETRLAELEPELRALLDPRRPGRGRALFAAVDGGAPRRFELHAPVPSLVALRPHAVVVPLLRVLQDGARAGAAWVSRDRVERAEWELGALRSETTIELDRGDARRRHRATNPAVPQPFPERDRFETAADARALAQLREEGARLATDAEVRGWDVVVANGDARLVDALVEGFACGNGDVELVRSPQPLGRLSADLVAGVVRTQRAERDAALARRLDESSAATRDPFVLEWALDEGRVQHLLLAAPGGPRPAYRAESLARRAFATGADVRVLDEGEHDLGPAGSAAVHRW
jgi:hypothetical protein